MAASKRQLEERLQPNFKLSEFACKCGCGLAIPQAQLVVTLQEIRDMLGRSIKITITSGCRCLEHNAKFSNLKGNALLMRGMPGGIDASPHTRGQAADFYVSGYTQLAAYNEIVKAHKEGKLPFLEYVYMLASSQGVLHLGVDNYMKRSNPYGGKQ